MENPFSYLELHTTDAVRAKAFYTELFNWKGQDQPVPGLGITYTELDTKEGPHAGLLPQLAPGAGSAWLSYVKVARLDESVVRAQSLGAQLVTPRSEVPGVGWFAVIRDPTGASIGLFERTAG